MAQNMTQQTPSKNGVILHEDAERVIIATGLKTSSQNTKTGGMIQLYILVRDVSPVEAVKSGSDVAICGDCPHRGAIVDGKLVGRRCYVNLGQGPRSVWQAYKNGRYRHALLTEYAAIFGGRAVRFGAYGDPAFVPENIIAEIARISSHWTGYSHQWKSTAWLKPFVMASCDSPEEAILANSTGWRSFRVSRKGDTTKLAGEISCPASKEGGKRTTCENCGLCDGSREMRETRKSIVIQDHSMIATSRPMGLIQIAA